MYIFADETGDLGFNFQKSKTSINKRKCKKYLLSELKGNNTRHAVKQYFYNHVMAHKNWCLYAITLDKQDLLYRTNVIPNHHRIYNILTHQLLTQIDFSKVSAVNLIIDKSKRKFHLKEFNEYLTTNLDVILPINTAFSITHTPSKRNRGVQAVDVFTYGFHRKYEYQDTEWYDVFREKIRIECEYSI